MKFEEIEKCKNCANREYCEFYSTCCYALEDENKDNWDELDSYINIQF